MTSRAKKVSVIMSLTASFVLGGALSFGSTAAPTSRPLTVGDFLLMYAGSTHMTLPPNASAETAMLALQAAKALPAGELALDRKLTHADVVKIARSAGLKVLSNTPDREMGRDEAQLFLDTFAKALTPAATETGPQFFEDSAATADTPGRANTDKGKKKGRPFQSPTNPL